MAAANKDVNMYQSSLQVCRVFSNLCEDYGQPEFNQCDAYLPGKIRHKPGPFSDKILLIWTRSGWFIMCTY